MKSIPLLLTLFIVSVPDVLMDGHRSVDHQLVLEASPALEGWRLLVTPVSGFHGVHVVEPGVAFRFSSKYGTKLYAIRAGEDLPAEPVSDTWKQERPSAAIPVAQISSVAHGHPLATVVTTLRVDALDDGVLQVIALESRHLDANGEEIGGVWPVVVLSGVASLGLLALLLLARRR